LSNRFGVYVVIALLAWVVQGMGVREVQGQSPPIGPTPLRLELRTTHQSQWNGEILESPVHHVQASGRGCPTTAADDTMSETIERVSGEEDGPRIAEPMVFDLVRPLGAKRGEGEVNVLGMVPLGRRSRRVADVPDSLGLVRRSPDRKGVEWAPEIEYAVCNGIGLEVEFPLENRHLEAYKGAVQVTFGTGFNHRFIHGAQGIVQYDRAPSLWTTTLLYLAGFRFNEMWSIFGMFGNRVEVSGPVSNKTVELLSNVSVFADLTNRLVAGIETNLGQTLGGNTEMLFMPQLHYEVDRYVMIQAGIGARFASGVSLPEAGFRLIREF